MRASLSPRDGPVAALPNSRMQELLVDRWRAAARFQLLRGVSSCSSPAERTAHGARTLSTRVLHATTGGSPRCRRTILASSTVRATAARAIGQSSNT